MKQRQEKIEKLVLKPKGAKLAMRFESENGQKIMLKVGISAVSIAGARKNLEAEAPHWDFEKYFTPF